MPPNAGGTIFIPNQPSVNGSQPSICGIFGQGIYNSSTVFNGIAYTNDQLALCGNPTFNGSPPIVSGAPSAIPYGDNWPGSQAQTVAGKTEYFPRGYTYDFTGGGCSSNSQPNYGSNATPKAPELNGNSQLPPTTAGFLPYADGLLAKGCVFTGPTMIEFVKGGTMNVWSPLTQNTEPANPTQPYTGCGTYSPGQPWQTGIAVPSGAVIYVEGEQSSGPNSGFISGAPAIITTPCSKFTTSSPPPTKKIDIRVCVPPTSGSGSYVPAGLALQPPVAGSSTKAHVPVTSCMDPFYYNTVSGGSNTVTASTPPDGCEEGDAIVEGEFTGQVTVAADNNIIVSRDLTYQCADGSGGATDVNPANVPACNGPGTNDVLALVPTDELIISGPTNQPFNTSCGGSGGGVGQCGNGAAPPCLDDGTGTPQTVANVVPWSCDINTTFPDGTNGVVIDAAAVDLNGSTYAQNFNVIGLGNANMYQNGTNINYFPGFNGSSTPTGYNQVITYDPRLSYENPPGLLQATDTVWNMTSFIICGTVNSANFPVTNPGTASAFQTISCPNLS